MKKSKFWFLLAIFWTVDAVWAIIRFFDVHITVQGKNDRWVKTVSREGDPITPARIANAALSVLLSNLYCAMFFKARKDEKRSGARNQGSGDDGE